MSFSAVCDILHIFTFFTAWSVLLTLFHKYTGEIVDLKFITFTTLLIGMYFSFIEPKKFHIIFNGVKYKFDGTKKFLLVDLIFHLCIFIYIMYIYHDQQFSWKRFLNSFILLVIYTCFVDVSRIYGVPISRCILLVVVSILLYFTYVYFLSKM